MENELSKYMRKKKDIIVTLLMLLFTDQDVISQGSFERPKDDVSCIKKLEENISDRHLINFIYMSWPWSRLEK